MSKKIDLILDSILLGKFVHGGQVLAETDAGKKIFVWGGLPGELVNVRVIKKKKGYLEAVVTDVLKASIDRIEPVEPNSYLSTSPWQIMTFDAENKAKQAILSETFEREGLNGIVFEPFVAFVSGREVRVGGFTPTPGTMRNPEGVSHNGYRYRNKQEFGFWGDDNGLHLAHYVRGTHGKQKVHGSVLAIECINNSAKAVLAELKKLNTWGGDLKTLVLRCSAKKEVAGALFIKKQLDLSDFELPKELKGIEIYFSDPKSPASVPTKKLYSFGDISLTDTILGKNIMYDVMSFFQVNIPIFEEVLKVIKAEIGTTPSIDMFSGVGAIGLSVGSTTLIDSDETNVKMALINAKGLNVGVIHANSEKSLENIAADKILIVDPPRAGLHKDLIDKLLESKPPKVIYLSCNPITQARDAKLIEGSYKITYAQGFNFFPRTPHIENLLVLELK